jgi:hypothetical protein
MVVVRRRGDDREPGSASIFGINQADRRLTWRRRVVKGGAAAQR